MMPSAATRIGRGGFTLIESLVAIALIGTVLAVLAPVLLHVAEQQVKDVGRIEREAILRGESNRLATLSFAALDGESGCASVTARARFPYSRCISVTAVSAGERTIRISVAPGNPEVPADSVVLTRTRAGGNPFDTTSP